MDLLLGCVHGFQLLLLKLALHLYMICMLYNTVITSPIICSFYLIQEQLPNDLIRVNMLFREAREAGIFVEVQSTMYVHKTFPIFMCLPSKGLVYGHFFENLDVPYMN